MIYLIFISTYWLLCAALAIATILLDGAEFLSAGDVAIAIVLGPIVLCEAVSHSKIWRKVIWRRKK
jgi:hypothetical protein